MHSKGSGPQSEEVFGETLANDPPKAPTLSVLNVDFESIEIKWSFEDSEESDVSDVNGFYIYSKSESEEWVEKEVISGNVRQKLLEKLLEKLLKQ